MTRSRNDHPSQLLVAHARELSALCGRALAISQALQALTGLDPVAERERLQRGPGAQALARVQSRVDTILGRAEAATRHAVGPQASPLSSPRRPRVARHFV